MILQPHSIKSKVWTMSLASSSACITLPFHACLTRKDLRTGYWQQHGGMTYATVLRVFVLSEFKNRYGATTTDTQYITTLYNNVLGRSPDAAGLANYQRLLANGKDRGALLLDFSESPENRVLFTEVTGLVTHQMRSNLGGNAMPSL